MKSKITNYFYFIKNTAGTAGIYACGDTSFGDIAYDISRYVSTKQESFLSCKEATTL